MKTSPQKMKYKKTRKGRLSKLEFKANSLRFGVMGLKAAESGVLKYKHIEAARQAITRKIKRRGKVWIRIFPYLPITSKPKGTRMGKGKGSISHWGARVSGGTTLFEICGVSPGVFFDALKTGGAKLPIKTKIFK